MSLLRDFLVAPRAGDAAVDERRRARGRRSRVAVAPVEAPTIGVLAPARELPAAGAGVGLALGRSAPAVLVCLGAPLPTGAFRVPARAGAARLAASLRARDLDACARGRLALVHLPDERRADAVTRALAAAGDVPSVLALAGRDDEIDALLAARDAIVVALAPSAEPAMAQLALAGAVALAPAAAGLTLALDPLQRALALAGARAPRAISGAVRGLVP